MKGQWIGTYFGSPNGGKITVNVDERESSFQAMGYVFPEADQLPNPVAYFSTPNKNRRFQCHTESIQAIDPASANVLPWDKVKVRYDEHVIFPQYGDITGSWHENSLSLSWVTDIGSSGTCVLPRSKAAEPSELVAVEKDWGAYKEYVGKFPHRGYLFRGQNNQKRLRTKFHRTGRANLSRFLNEDVPALHQHLSARTRHLFNLQNPDENGAFWNLAQHHGYPTPLLDWTYSPYVAAFFAYRRISNEQAAAASLDAKVRIFIFDQQQWKVDWLTSQMLLVPADHLSVLVFIAIENERVIPQQAVSTVTNVDDIESYIKSKESETKKYLLAIDLPVRECRSVVRELGSMGITAGSLFPGLDGACEELTERNFEI
jgi:hypothetical protein